MVIVSFGSSFEKSFKKIKNDAVKSKLKKQIKKTIEKPDWGKPMRYNRKGTREFYLSPYRISYMWIKEENKIIFLDLYHKDEQ